MILFSKPIEKVTWDDVVAFCGLRAPEGAHLDYKVDFPNGLEKTIAAMANTLGGIIFIGVEEDGQGRPVLPLRGVATGTDPATRVWNIVLSHITPPPMGLEIGVCTDPTANSAVVVIRIPQSDGAPHAIAENTSVYLRTGNRNRPERLADLNEVGWLQQHRRRSEDLREALCEQAVRRCSVLCDRDPSGGQAPLGADRSRSPWLTLSVHPVYPKDVLKDPTELRAIAERLQVLDYYGGGNRFPPKAGDPLLVQDGAILHPCPGVEAVAHVEMNSFGLLFYTQTISSFVKAEGGKPVAIVRLEEILARLDQFLELADQFMRELGFWGLLEFRVHLEGTGSFPLLVVRPIVPEVRRSPDPGVQYRRVLPAGGLMDLRIEMIPEVIQKIAWAHGLIRNVDWVARVYKELKKEDWPPKSTPP